MASKKKLLQAASGVGGAGLDVDDCFSCFLYTGNGTAGRTITNNIDISTEGGLIWTKSRSSTYNHTLGDTVNGVNKYLYANTTADIDTSSAYYSAFNTNGYVIGDAAQGFNANELNANSVDYVSWTFRKAKKFFDIVTYTGNGSARTISHNLGSVPGMILVKITSGADDWVVYHRGMDGSAPEDYRMLLNDTGARVDAPRFNDTAPTSTEFSVDSDTSVNGNGSTYIAYLFAHNDDDGGFGESGDQDIIKCGDFTTDGSENATVTLGFEPQWVLWKETTRSTNWGLADAMRGMPVGGNDALIEVNANGAETAGVPYISLTPTGFKVSNMGASKHSIFMAIRRGPLAEPTDATKVFTPVLGDGSGTPSIKTSHVVDFGITFNKTGGGSVVGTRLLGTKQLQTHTTNAESNNTYLEWDFMNGWHTWTGLNTNYINWNWKRAPSYFDVCCYTGAGAAQTVNHNLGVVPEMMWIKNRGSAENWAVYHSALGTSKYLHLNTTDPALTTDAANRWNNTSPTATQFSVGTSTEVSHFTRGFVALLFATVAGVSKVGSYDGNGSNQNIDCGFSSGARFILIKSIQSGSWYVFDTVRGIVSGNDGHLKLNTNDAEAYADSIDTYSGGFNVVQNSTTDLNKGPSDESYIFYAIA